MSVAVKWEELEVFEQFTDVLAWVARIAKADPMNEALRDETVARVEKSWAEITAGPSGLGEGAGRVEGEAGRAECAQAQAPHAARTEGSPLFRRNAI